MASRLTLFKDGDKSFPCIELRNIGPDGQESKFGFSFGLTKAKMILSHLDDIRAFVAVHTKEKDGE